jgi:hypothetical protein
MAFRTVMGLVLIAAVFMIVVGTQPSTFHIERTIVVAAAPDAVFPRVNNLRDWQAWSPWEKLDPRMERTYSGPSQGVGASYAWVSSPGKAGQGRMTIESSQAPTLIGIKLELFKPFPAKSDVTFTFLPVSEGTRVTWSMDGRSGFLGKAFHLVANVDKQVGGDFERGLIALKTLVEHSGPSTSELAGAKVVR